MMSPNYIFFDEDVEYVNTIQNDRNYLQDIQGPYELMYKCRGKATMKTWRNEPRCEYYRSSIRLWENMNETGCNVLSIQDQDDNLIINVLIAPLSMNTLRITESTFSTKASRLKNRIVYVGPKNAG